MHCSRCGKEINYEATVCLECEAQANMNSSFYNAEPAQPTYQQPVYQQPMYQQPVYAQPMMQGGANPRMYGFGGALTSTILSVISWVFWMFSMLGVYGMFVGGGALFIIMTVITWGLCTASIVLGAISIKKFNEARRNGQPAPIATLILGISGLADGALAALFSFIFFFALMALLV